MKRSIFITILVGAVIVIAAALSGCSGSSNAPTPTPKPVKTTTDVLEKFDALKTAVNSSGMWFGGAAVQNIQGDETAMVYLYKPVGATDVSDLLSTGYNALYSIFETEDPLLVGVIDTSQKISANQYKVDVYSLDRPLVELYKEGNITKTEMTKKALFITPQSESIRTMNVTPKPTVALPVKQRNYTAPADRQATLVEFLNKTGYKPIGLQGGTLPDGGKAVNLALAMPAGMSNADKYKEIEAGLQGCAEAFGDYDRYYLTLGSQGGDEYYVIDAGALPVADYTNGDINQDQFYKAINLTYYTK